MALYRHLASGTTPGEVFNFSVWSNGNVSLAAAHANWDLALAALWDGGVGALTANEVAITSTSTAEVDVATGRQSTRVDSAVSMPGTSASEMLPYQCATVVSLRTVFATRSGRGRFYLPPLAVASIIGGRLTPANTSAIADAAETMMTTLQSAGLTPVVYSRVAKAAVTIVSVDVGDVIDTQRRRRNKLVEARESRAI